MVGEITMVPSLGSGRVRSSFSTLAALPLTFFINGFHSECFSKSVSTCHTREGDAEMSISVMTSHVLAAELRLLCIMSSSSTRHDLMLVMFFSATFSNLSARPATVRKCQKIFTTRYRLREHMQEEHSYWLNLQPLNSMSVYLEHIIWEESTGKPLEVWKVQKSVPVVGGFAAAYREWAWNLDFKPVNQDPGLHIFRILCLKVCPYHTLPASAFGIINGRGIAGRQVLPIVAANVIKKSSFENWQGLLSMSRSTPSWARKKG